MVVDTFLLHGAQPPGAARLSAHAIPRLQRHLRREVGAWFRTPRPRADSNDKMRFFANRFPTAPQARAALGRHHTGAPYSQVCAAAAKSPFWGGRRTWHAKKRKCVCRPFFSHSRSENATGGRPFHSPPRSGRGPAPVPAVATPAQRQQRGRHQAARPARQVRGRWRCSHAPPPPPPLPSRRAPADGTGACVDCPRCGGWEARAWLFFFRVPRLSHTINHPTAAPRPQPPT